MGQQKLGAAEGRIAGTGIPGDRRSTLWRPRPNRGRETVMTRRKWCARDGRSHNQPTISAIASRPGGRPRRPRPGSPAMPSLLQTARALPSCEAWQRARPRITRTARRCPSPSSQSTTVRAADTAASSASCDAQLHEADQAPVRPVPLRVGMTAEAPVGRLLREQPPHPRSPADVLRRLARWLPEHVASHRRPKTRLVRLEQPRDDRRRPRSTSEIAQARLACKRGDVRRG